MITKFNAETRKFFDWFERNCEKLNSHLKKWAFLDVLERLGKLAVLVAIISWICELPSRRKATENQRKSKIFQAWQVINSCHGRGGSGGRADAIHDLIEEGESLEGIDLSGKTDAPHAMGFSHLPGLKVQKANLKAANFTRAMLEQANFSNCVLENAVFDAAKIGESNFTKAMLHAATFNNASIHRSNFTGAILTDANFLEAFAEGAVFRGADLVDVQLLNTICLDADFSGADLGGDSDLTNSDLRNAKLINTNLKSAKMSKVNLGEADVKGANLSYVDLRGADLRSLKHWDQIQAITLANIAEVTNAPEGFLTWAKGKGAVIASDSEWQKLLRAHFDSKRNDNPQ